MKKRVTKKGLSKAWQIVIGIAIVVLLLGIVLTIVAITKDGEEPMINENIITINTSKGNIVVELNEEAAPLTVANFKEYIRQDFYNGTVFHRVISDFMIQGGGFTPDGNQKKTNPPIILEASLSNDRGTIAMARTNAPNSATSQFFINHADNQFLNPAPGNPGYAVFGKVISGMDIVDDIAKVKTGSKPMNDWPVENVIINSITFGGSANV